MRVKDREILRSLAFRWMEKATSPVMEKRKRLWTALKDLRAERPLVLFETWTLEDYVSESELECEDPTWRSVERHFRWVLRHVEEVGDDIVIEPVWRIGWSVHASGYGVEVRSHHATDVEGGRIGYAFDHPIRTPADLDRLTRRTFRVDRERTRKWFEQLSDVFGDILPVVLHGTRGLHAGLTQLCFKLIGNDNLLTWPFDEPEALHRVMAFLRDDFLAYFDFLERERLLGLNNDATLVGSGSPGYTTALPAAGYAGVARLCDLWVWMESQETTCISPAMFDEFFLPYMADVARRFGLVYYGCCEPVHDRWDLIRRAMPHVRACSVSPWCDQFAVAERFGREVVFSRKPKPWPLSGAVPDWDELKKDLHETLGAARDCHLEIIYRDVYRIHGDRRRLSQWTQMVKTAIGA